MGVRHTGAARMVVMRHFVAFAAALALAAMLSACATPQTPAARDSAARDSAARNRDIGDAQRFEIWMQPRLDAVQVMLDASRDGLDFVALVLRARQPGAGVAPPPLDAAAAAVGRAAESARRLTDGLAPWEGGDAEQRGLAADAQAHVARMQDSLAVFAASLPRLAEVGSALGPLGHAENAAIAAPLSRLLDLQVRADMVFADLVVGLLTPDSDALPERELQSARWRGNAILLHALAGLGGAAPAGRAFAVAAAERQRDLDVAMRKVDALRAAAAGLPQAQAGPIARIIRSYELGLEAEEDFLAAVGGFAAAIEAIDRGATQPDGRIALAFENARLLMDRLVHRMRANLTRLRMLTEIGAGRRA